MIDMDHLRTDVADVIARDIDDAEAHCARVALAFAALVEPLRAWVSYIGREIVDGDERHLDPQERNLRVAWRSVEAQITKESTP